MIFPTTIFINKLFDFDLTFVIELGLIIAIQILKMRLVQFKKKI